VAKVVEFVVSRIRNSDPRKLILTIFGVGWAGRIVALWPPSSGAWRAKDP